jgi:5'-nucleotidase
VRRVDAAAVERKYGKRRTSIPNKERPVAQSRIRQWRRVARLLAVPLLAASVIAFLPAGPNHPKQAQAAWTPMSPVTVSFERTDPRTPVATAHLLATNDFHGNIDPPAGTSGLINNNPAGGVEYLATWIKRLRAQALQKTPNVWTVAAGDLIGASPLVSAAFHDEPTIEEMNSLGLQIASVGNHEFDEGVTELRRMQFGSCHPTDGCQDGDGFAGARFRYLAANVTNKSNGLPILLPIDIKFAGNVPVAFVGMTLKGTPSIVNPAGITTVDFRDEVVTANRYAQILGKIGIHSLVLLIHQGGSQQATPPALPDISSCANFVGDITPIVAGLRPEYGLVISGHTHQFYSCALPNSSGANSVVTSASSFGRMITDVSVTLDKRTRRFAAISAHNVIVENGVRNPDGTWATDAKGNFIRNPALVDADAKVIADKYRTAVAPLANRVVGRITADIVQAAGANGESPLGDVIADAQLAYTTQSGAQIALMNPGGIRTSLVRDNSPGGEALGEVTYGECFAVQPFNNLVVTQTFTGAQLTQVLEQQFIGFGGQTTQRILQVSAGFTYSYDTTKRAGDKVSNLVLNGTPIDAAATYRVTTNDFLANGGDGFTNLKAGTARATASGFDVDALVAYLGANSPVAPGPANRIQKVA